MEQWEIGCCCSVTQSCLILRDPMDCSTPGFSVLHYLLEFAQTHVHWVCDAIQPSHPLSSPSPLALNLSQHQGLFQEIKRTLQDMEIVRYKDQCLPRYVWDRAHKWESLEPGLRSRPFWESKLGLLFGWKVTGKLYLWNLLDICPLYLAVVTYRMLGKAFHGVVSPWRYSSAEVPEGKCWGSCWWLGAGGHRAL